MKRYLTEFIGTFFLVATIGFVIVAGSTEKPVILAPLAIGSVLMVMVYMGGHVSGAHYNPAVSVAILLRGKLPLIDFLPYIVSQLLGALAAAAVVHQITGKFFPLKPGPSVNAGNALLVEILFTFALALVILNVATSQRTQGNSYYGLAIGFTIVAGALAAGDISGGAFNPAVGTGPILFAALNGDGGYGNLWIYWVGPLAGAVLATAVFMLQESGAPAK